jgi:hypothetical protein
MFFYENVPLTLQFAQAEFSTNHPESMVKFLMANKDEALE